MCYTGFPRKQLIFNYGTPVKSILIFSHDLLSHDALDAMTFLRKARIFELLVISGLLPQEEKEPETVYLQC